jgi:hypothetical protein
MMLETIYVAISKDVKESKLNLIWGIYHMLATIISLSES